MSKTTCAAPYLMRMPNSLFRHETMRSKELVRYGFRRPAGEHGSCLAAIEPGGSHCHAARPLPCIEKKKTPPIQCFMRLQATVHTVAGYGTYGCRIRCVRLQVTVHTGAGRLHREEEDASHPVGVCGVAAEAEGLLAVRAEALAEEALDAVLLGLGLGCGLGLGLGLGLGSGLVLGVGVGVGV